jgi:hypothetical protein
VLKHLLRDVTGNPFDIRQPLWSWRSAASTEPIFSLIFRSSEALDRLLHHPSETALGEASVSGELDVKGDIFSAFDIAEWLLNRNINTGNRFLNKLGHDYLAFISFLTRGAKYSKRRDADSIHHYYRSAGKVL